MDKIREGVSKYYTEKIEQHGQGALGVDWNSKESQYLRFEQLSKVITGKDPFRVLDYGCGYGEYVKYLDLNFKNADYHYTGYDVSPKMISEAQKGFAGYEKTNFVSEEPVGSFDFVIASGIFNVKMDLATNEEWLNYITGVLNTFNGLATGGFSFNALTKYSDKEFMKDYLYYADPLFLFDYCKQNFSRNVALLHDYNLYEFTIIVRK